MKAALYLLSRKLIGTYWSKLNEIMQNICVKFKALCFKPFKGRSHSRPHFHCLPLTALLNIHVQRAGELIIFLGEEPLDCFKTWIACSFCSLPAKCCPVLLEGWRPVNSYPLCSESSDKPKLCNAQAKTLVFVMIPMHGNDDVPPSIPRILYKIKIYCSMVSLLHCLNGFSPRNRLRVWDGKLNFSICLNLNQLL